jgi:hypothetical protein
MVSKGFGKNCMKLALLWISSILFELNHLCEASRTTFNTLVHRH